MVEAIEALPADAPRATVPAARTAVEDELGDLLFQVVFHAVLAEEAGAFTIGRRRARHPRQARAPPPARVRRRRGREHVDDVMRNWEQIKKDEKGTTSIVDRHHARPAVAPLHAQAVPQGGVGRPRSRRRDDALARIDAVARRAPRRRRPTSKPARASCLAAAVVLARVAVASTPSPPSAAGRYGSVPIRGDGTPGRGEAAGAAGAHARGCGGALDRDGRRGMSRASRYTIQGHEVTIPVEVRDA